MKHQSLSRPFAGIQRITSSFGARFSVPLPLSVPQPAPHPVVRPGPSAGFARGACVRQLPGRVVRDGLVPLALVASVAFLAGCGDSEVTEILGATADAEALTSGLAGLTVDQLPGELALTEAQARVLSAALAELESARAEMRANFESVREGGRGRRGDGPAGPGQPGDGRGPGAGGAGPFGGAKFADGEPPFLAFLGTAAETLDRDQFVILATYLAENRPMRERTGEHGGPGWSGRGDGPGRSARGDEGMGRRGGALGERMMGRLAADLDLSEDDAARLRELHEATREELRSLRDDVREGALEPETALSRAIEVTQAARAQLASVLDVEQIEKLEARRMERREMAMTQRLEGLDERLERRAEVVAAALDLEEAQAAAARAIFAQTAEARREVLAGIESGEEDPEVALFRGIVIEKQAADEVRALLTPEQQEDWDTLRGLLPGAGAMGGERMGRKGW